MTCLICQQDVTQDKLFDIECHKTHKNYAIKECPSCTVKSTYPVPDIDLYYQSDTFRQAPAKLSGMFKRILINLEMRRVVDLVEPGKFLDVGVGYGDFSLALFNAGYDVVALDSAPDRPYYIEKVAEIPYKKLNYETLEIENTEYIQGRAVILRHVLEHIKDPQRFLETFLARGASYFYIAVPNASASERKTFGRYAYLWGIPFHLWHFDEHSLSVLLEKNGLKIIKTGYDTVPTVLPNVYHYLRMKNYPLWLRNIFTPNAATYALSVPLNIFFPRNVVWMVAKAEQ